MNRDMGELDRVIADLRHAYHIYLLTGHVDRGLLERSIVRLETLQQHEMSTEVTQ